jgi:sarcosine oxidase subunit beta
MIDVAEAQRLSPLIATDGLLAAAWSPTDGHCTPESVVLGYASAPAAPAPRCCRTARPPASRSPTGGHRVHTAAGTVRTDAVVCAAGAWSAEVGGWAGVDLPVTPLRRQVLVTEPVPGLDPHTPFTIDFATSFYFHREGRGLLMGMSDPDETPGFRLDPLRRVAAPARARRSSGAAPALAGVGVPAAGRGSTR